MTKRSENRAVLVKDFFGWLPHKYDLVITEGFPDDWCAVEEDEVQALISRWADGKAPPGEEDVSPEVIAALRTFRDLHGRKWREVLRRLWDSGLDEGVLRLARNEVGPTRLDLLKL